MYHNNDQNNKDVVGDAVRRAAAVCSRFCAKSLANGRAAPQTNTRSAGGEFCRSAVGGGRGFVGILCPERLENPLEMAAARPKRQWRLFLLALPSSPAVLPSSVNKKSLKTTTRFTTSSILLFHSNRAPGAPLPCKHALAVQHFP